MSRYFLRKPLAGLTPEVTQGLRWRLFDCQGEVLGRLASRIAVVLQGKDKPTYSPNEDKGDICVVVNAKDITLTGNKLTDKKYYWHTGYIGHVKERTVKEQMVRDSTEVLRKAVHRMLPRNKLRDDRMLKLRIFPEGEHPFPPEQMDKFEMPPRKVREMRPRARRAALRAQPTSTSTKA